MKIEKASKIIKITDIFNGYKSVLIKNMMNKPEYKEYSHIFNNVDINIWIKLYNRKRGIFTYYSFI